MPKTRPRGTTNPWPAFSCSTVRCRSRTQNVENRSIAWNASDRCSSPVFVRDSWVDRLRHCPEMTAPTRRDSRFLRVCCALLIVFGLTSATDLAQSPAATPIDPAKKNATAVESIAEKTVETVFDEGTERNAVAPKSAKGVGWKIGRASSIRDSYLEALSHSRTSTDPREGVVSTDATSPSQRRREYVPGPVYTGKDADSATTHPRIVYGSPDRDSFSMVPSDSYSLPSRGSVDFAGFQNSYGQSQPPRATYGPPSHSYPTATYGPPSHSYPTATYNYSPPQQAYGPPAPVYGAPHGISESPSFVLPTIDFSWPFALKLNAFTLAKILLKLVIFKMIVKFIAVICLLLFIPKLEIKKKGNRPSMHDDDDDDNDDEGRRSIDGEIHPRFWKRLNELAAFASDAFEEYESLNDAGRSNEGSVASRDSQRRPLGETWHDYDLLLRSYALEEARFAQSKS